MIRKPRWPQTLRHLDLFADCSNGEPHRVAPLVTAVAIDAGDVLMREGSRGSEFMVIAEGTVVVARETSERHLAVIGPGASGLRTSR